MPLSPAHARLDTGSIIVPMIGAEARWPVIGHGDPPTVYPRYIARLTPSRG